MRKPKATRREMRRTQPQVSSCPSSMHAPSLALLMASLGSGQGHSTPRSHPGRVLLLLSPCRQTTLTLAQAQAPPPKKKQKTAPSAEAPHKNGAVANGDEEDEEAEGEEDEEEEEFDEEEGDLEEDEEDEEDEVPAKGVGKVAAPGAKAGSKAVAAGGDEED